MRDPNRIDEILKQVGTALLNKGEGHSIGQLVADLEGDGLTKDSDPYNVWDEHFYHDVSVVDGWPDEPRSMEDVNEVIDAFEAYWTAHPDMRFCQIICNCHIVENGLGNFHDGEGHYTMSIAELSDEQLVNYFERQMEKVDEA